jgi:phenylalanine-4-hydroxylase
MQLAQFISNAGPQLRGDYARARDDFTIDQTWHAYSDEEHALWRRLYARQMQRLPGYGFEPYLECLARFDAGNAIPRFEQVSERLSKASGWEIVAVPGLIPDLTFFEHLAARRFPVTVWLRRPEEVDYIVEPDVFHDFFGHVPLLFQPAYADYMQAYGQGGLKAARLDALQMLARLYWYTVEFGLIRTAHGLRVYGAGILSSGGELVHAIDSPAPRRIAFDLERVLRTDYRIDRYQDTYFVIEDFDSLVGDTAPDFTPIYERVRRRAVLAPDAPEAGDRLLGSR